MEKLFAILSKSYIPQPPHTSFEEVESMLMGDSSQFSPLTTLSEQLGPNSWVSSVFIPAFIANI